VLDLVFVDWDWLLVKIMHQRGSVSISFVVDTFS
jgi:hypothetical protein